MCLAKPNPPHCHQGGPAALRAPGIWTQTGASQLSRPGARGHPGERTPCASLPALGPQESGLCAPESWSPGEFLCGHSGAREAPDPPGPALRYLAAIQLTQLLHDPLLQHKPLPKLLAIVFHCHFSLLVAPLLLLLLLLNLPRSGRRGHRRRVLPGGA